MSASCSETVLAISRFDNNGGLSCSSNSGYDFVMAAGPISASKLAVMCAESSCKELVAAIRAAVPRECAYTSMSQIEVQLYADILDPIEKACASSLVTTSSPPGTTTASPTVTTITPTSSPTESPSRTPTQVTSAPSSTAYSSDSTGDSTSTVIGISIGAIAVVAIIAFIFGRSRRRNRRTSLPDPQLASDGNEFATNGTYVQAIGATPSSFLTSNATSLGSKSALPVGVAGGAVDLWSDPAIQRARIPLDDIKLGQVLSAGAFGEVLLASYNNQKVAVKRLLPARRKNMTEIESFLEEAKLMTTLRHQRIVRLIGVAWDSLSDLCVVTEYMNGGDLRTLLAGFASRNAAVGFNSDKVKIAVHVVHALSYLHGLRPSIVHRDLKSKNVLLTDGLDAKLTDFGVSRQRAEQTMTAGVGTSLWMAPEIMMGDRYDEKADMFSFGVVLSEIDTHRLPYADAKEPGTERQLNEMAILQLMSMGELQVTFSDQADADIVAIARECMSISPEQRPTANDVLRRLHHVWLSYGTLV